MKNADLLPFYTRQTPNTDPGEYGALFHALPQGLPELCRLIKCQLIHPARIKKERHLLTEYTRKEDENFDKVSEMLEALVERNADGLTADRLPSERLLLSCRFHSLLLISMLRSRGVPARSRVGFASYLSENNRKYIDHWICEVWEEAEQRWIRVDPDQERIDIQGDEFLVAGDAWLMARDKEINPQLFGVKKSWGMPYIRNNLCYDLNAVLGNELGYWDYPPLCQKEMDKLNGEELSLLDEIALYLQDPDEHHAKLQALFSEHDVLQFNR
ncbi:transglutaminase domain-containing protein [Brevibacillus sp. SAFN-007a]|uniref:transglutaminase domain-containing protein n=1 Tax=Brevibacillus sp. SAFN-007a TaxID=3436862 RepID=UPI003F80EBAB